MSKTTLRFGLPYRAYCQTCEEETIHVKRRCAHCQTENIATPPRKSPKPWNSNPEKGIKR